MDDPLYVICHETGFFTRAHAREAGYDDQAIAREMSRGHWVRVRRGYYTFASIWSGADEIERHLILSKCVLDALGGKAVLSHGSGCVAHGVDVWGVDLTHVHVTRLDGGAGRTEAGVVHHEGFVADEEIVEVRGLKALSPQRCVLEAGAAATPEAALVLLNSALHKSLCCPDEIFNRFDLMTYWPHTRHLHVPVRMCTPKAESVGESRSLWLFWTQRLPAPALQVEVRDPNGVVIGRTDFAWPKHGGLGEFDGRVKYGRLLKPGQDPGDAVFGEKVREDRLREVTGAWMLRLIWSDLDHPAQTAQRLRRLMGAAG